MTGKKTQRSYRIAYVLPTCIKRYKRKMQYLGYVDCKKNVFVDVKRLNELLDYGCTITESVYVYLKNSKLDLNYALLKNRIR